MACGCNFAKVFGRELVSGKQAGVVIDAMAGMGVGSEKKIRDCPS